MIVWWLRDTIGVLGFGFFLGLRMAASGWQTLAAPTRDATPTPSTRLKTSIPNRALGLPPHPIIGFIHREAIARRRDRARRPTSTGA